MFANVASSCRLIRSFRSIVLIWRLSFCPLDCRSFRLIVVCWFIAHVVSINIHALSLLSSLSLLSPSRFDRYDRLCVHLEHMSKKDVSLKVAEYALENERVKIDILRLTNDVAC
jgi:hypothetical protein